ncbi:MAG: heparinase II/III family protein [Clostridia bacterium]|nr:heparinase II/III family protein [Clostridia bacterium]
MKNKLTRLISLILMLATLVSCFAVFASAETEGGEGETEKKPVVVYNRDFGDGWEVYNGLGTKSQIMKGNNYFIDRELTVSYDYNYFARFEVLTPNDGFAQLQFKDPPKTDKVYIEFDIMADDYFDPNGNILYSRLEGASTNGRNIPLLGVKENRLYPFGQFTGQSVELVDKWVPVRIVYDYTDEELLANGQLVVEITLGEGENAVTKRNIFEEMAKGYIGLDILRFGFGPNIPESKWGMSWCLDNLRVYHDVTEPMTEEELDEYGYGYLVNENQAKVVDVSGNGAQGDSLNAFDTALVMKVGVDNMIFKGETEKIYDGTYGGPREIDGKIYVPLEILLGYVGYPYYVHEDGKSYDISTGTDAAYITIGRNVATVAGEVVTLSAAPAYVTAENGKQYPVIAMDDVETLLPGFYLTYDDMGLVIVARVDNIVSRDTGLEAMMDLMKQFIFDYADAETIYENAVEHTQNFTHPYLVADGERFALLQEIYSAYTDGVPDEKDVTYDVNIQKALTDLVNRSYSLYEMLAKPSYSEPVLDENGEQMYKNGDPVKVPLLVDGRPSYDNNGNQKMTNLVDENGNVVYEQVPVMIERYEEWVGFKANDKNVALLEYPHVSTNGYDPAGGRQGESQTTLGWARDIAFGYAITGDIKLAQCVYEILVKLGNWNHWCPGHFLNTADATQYYSLAFDWIYNGVLELAESSDYYSVSYLQDLLYKNGVHMGYLSSTKQPHGWTRPQGDVYFYSTMANNWNAVCTAGMWLGSLMLLENDKYKDEAASLISMNIESFANYGLSQYAPDGAYVEGPGYWGYGTNSMFLGLMGLQSATGSTYGFENTWGIDKTCYFACNIMSSDFKGFSYHDSGIAASTDTSHFYFVSQMLNDPVLAGIRKIHNLNGKGYSWSDMLWYPFETDGEELGSELPLDYYSSGIDVFTTRSSWDKGALFAGMISGPNTVSHGQIDCGAFAYYNKGVIWITDLGADQYNAYQYFGGEGRYRYYRMNTEGNNVLAMVGQPEKLPFGQDLTGVGHITETYSDKFGSYVINDTTDVYGGFAQYAYRGMLLTNDRKTLIVQDEAQFFGMQEMRWFAHIDTNSISYEISTDGRTMMLYTKRGSTITNTVRMTIVSKNTSHKFYVTTTGEEDFFLKGDRGTAGPDWSTSMGGYPENPRNQYRRIVIGDGGMIEFKCAVVIEWLEPGNENIDVGYEWTNMADWVTTADKRGEEKPIEPDGPIKRGKRSLSTINRNMQTLERYVQDGTMYGKNIDTTDLALSHIEYVIGFFRTDPELDSFKNQVDRFDIYKAEYDAYADMMNEKLSFACGVSELLMGI